MSYTLSSTPTGLGLSSVCLIFKCRADFGDEGRLKQNVAQEVLPQSSHTHTNPILALTLTVYLIQNQMSPTTTYLTQTRTLKPCNPSTFLHISPPTPPPTLSLTPILTHLTLALALTCAGDCDGCKKHGSTESIYRLDRP